MAWRRSAIGIGLAFVCGCGPQRLGNLDAGTAASTSETSSSGESTSESESTTESSTETTTEDTTDDPTETSETDPFVPDSDMSEPNVCDPWEQDCDEGEKCVPYASTGGNWDANKCVPVLGDQQPGEPCIYGGVVEATDDCDATSFCWDVMDIDGEWIGECLPFCMGTPDSPECPPGSACLIAGDGSILLCISSCDPILQDCNAGLGCFWAVNDFQCIFTTQDLPTGAPCEFINDCAIGNVCTAAASLPACDGASCCAAFCDLEQGDLACAPQPGTSCVPFFADGTAPPGYEEVGHCVLP